MSNTKLNILIVEDSLSFALELEMLVKELHYHVLARVDNSAEALELIFANHPDLILMDIEIKGSMTGTQIGQSIRHLNIPILYISSMSDEQNFHAAEASNMIGYLVKPIDKISLRSAIQLAIAKAYIDQIKQKQSDVAAQPSLPEPVQEEHFLMKDCYFFKKKDVFHKVKIEDICIIKSNDNYCTFYTVRGEQFTSRIALGKLESMLPADIFFRPHRQYIVQISCIEKINLHDSTIIVAKQEIPLSRSKRQELEQKITKMS